MAFIPAPNGAQVVIEYGNNTNQWTNTLWFEKADFDLDDLTELTTTVFDYFAAEMTDHMDSDWSARQATGRDMRTSDGAVVTYNPADTPGQLTGTESPLNSAVIVTFRTAKRGRSFRGRNYLTGFTEDDIGAMQMTDAGIIAAIQTLYDDLIDEVAAINWTWVICSRFEEGLPRTLCELTAVIAAEVRTGILGSQRRRIKRP